jgi:hypothetical protein
LLADIRVLTTTRPVEAVCYQHPHAESSIDTL